jgi:hypothetical protein
MVLLRDVGQVKTRFGPFGVVLISVQDRYMVCDECSTSMEIGLGTPDGTPRKCMKWELVSVCLEIVLVSAQDRCTVCAEHTIGS